MKHRPDQRPKQKQAPKLKRVRCMRLTGRGAVVLHLNGTGRIRIRRARGDSFRFEGSGTPRYLSGECILLTGADGRLYVRGLRLEVEFTGGTADLEATGDFQHDRLPRPGSRLGLRKPPKRAA